MVLFSVIIPHYNTPNSLKKLIQSIPQNERIQLIVVDDKSTDDISSVKQLTISRGGSFLHNTTEYKGAGTCRNLGLQIASGKWLIFADADDYFLDNSFHVMEMYSNSKADIIYFPPISKYSGTNCLAKRHKEYEKMVLSYLNHPNERNEMLLRYKFMSPWSKMIRNKLVQKNHIVFDEVPAANDVMFSLQAAYYAQKIEASMNHIYCITQSNNTLTTLKNESNYWSRVEVFTRRYKFMQEHLDLVRLGYVLPMGIRILTNAIKQHYSVRFIFKIYHYLKKNNISLFPKQAIQNKAKNLMIKEKKR